MFSVLIGLGLVIVAVLVWIAALTVAQGLAIFIGLVGIMVLLYGLGERARYTRL